VDHNRAGSTWSGSVAAQSSSHGSGAVGWPRRSRRQLVCRTRRPIRSGTVDTSSARSRSCVSTVSAASQAAASPRPMPRGRRVCRGSSDQCSTCAASRDAGVPVRDRGWRAPPVVRHVAHGVLPHDGPGRRARVGQLRRNSDAPDKQPGNPTGCPGTYTCVLPRGNILNKARVEPDVRNFAEPGFDNRDPARQCGPTDV
jgi:hypothetical protein